MSAFPLILGRRRRGGPYRPGANYYVSPSGNDSNAGTSAGSPWQTDTKLRTAISNGTIRAGVFFYKSTGLAVPFKTLSELGQKGVADALIAGMIAHSGDVINFLGVIPLTSHFAQGNAIGGRVVNWGTAGGVDNSRTLASSGWTNPSGSIWKLASPAGVTPAAGVIWEGNTQLTPTWGANFAAATAALGSAGTFYVEPASGDVYVHATAGGSPNSNGLVYKQAKSWFASDAPLIDMAGGYMTATPANYGIVKYTATYDPTDTGGHTIFSSNVGSGDGSKVTVIQRTIHDRFGKHAFELAAGSHDANAAQSTGMFIVDDCHTTNAPTGLSPGSYSDFVAFLDLIGIGAGKFYVRYNNCQDAVGSTGGWLSHNNGGSLQIRRIEWTNCTANGGGGFGAAECGNAVVTNCTFGAGVSFNATTSTTVTGTTFNYRLPDLGNNNVPVGPITLAGNVFSPGVVFASNCALGGSGGTTMVSSAGNVYNLSGGNGNSPQWIRGGVVNFTSTGDTINAHTVAPPFQTITPAAGDTYALVGTTIYADPAAPFTLNYAGATTKTWTTIVANGTAGIAATGGCTLNGAPVGTGAPANLYTGIVHTFVQGNVNGGTAGPIDMANKNFAYVGLGCYSGVTGLTLVSTNNNVPDGNTWVPILTKTFGGATNAEVTGYYCANPATPFGSTMRFVFAGTNVYPIATVISANKPSGTPVLDGQAGFNNGGATCPAGNLTPSVAGSLLITNSVSDVADGATFTIDRGYTVSDQGPQSTGNFFGGGAAYMQAGAVAKTDPTWSVAAGHVRAATLACFK